VGPLGITSVADDGEVVNIQGGEKCG